MATTEKELLLMFAKELREIVESFEEEARILADEDIVEEIHESEEAYKKGDVRRFKDVEELKKELGL